MIYRFSYKCKGLATQYFPHWIVHLACYCSRTLKVKIATPRPLSGLSTWSPHLLVTLVLRLPHIFVSRMLTVRRGHGREEEQICSFALRYLVKY